MSKPVSIYIQSKDLTDLIDFYDQKLKAIKQKKKDLERDESEIRATIMQLKSKKVDDNSDIDSPIRFSVRANMDAYDSKWTWVKKIDFAIREAGKPITTNEIVDILIIYEPSFDDDKRKAISSVSSITSVNSGTEEEEDKKFIKIEDETGRSKFFIKDDSEQSAEAIELPPLIVNTSNEVDDLPF